MDRLKDDRPYIVYKRRKDFISMKFINRVITKVKESHVKDIMDGIGYVMSFVIQFITMVRIIGNKA